MAMKTRNIIALLSGNLRAHPWLMPAGRSGLNREKASVIGYFRPTN
jgi:hypothetical protein